MVIYQSHGFLANSSIMGPMNAIDAIENPPPRSGKTDLFRLPNTWGLEVWQDPKNIPIKHRENLRRYDWKTRVFKWSSPCLGWLKIPYLKETSLWLKPMSPSLKWSTWTCRVTFISSTIFAWICLVFFSTPPPKRNGLFTSRVNTPEV